MLSCPRRYLVAWTMAGLAAASCSLPAALNNPDFAGTNVAATIYILQTGAAATQTALLVEVPTSAATPVPTITVTPSITPTPGNPTVTKLTLCLTGPGNVYNVVSSLKPGTQVELLGVGSVAGWLVVQNPTYHQRCWVAAQDLQLDPALNLSTLQVFNPPPTPGPKYTPTPTP